LAEQFLYYYLLLTAEECYVKRQHKKAKAIIRFINPSYLQKTDAQRYKKVKFRNAVRAWL
jgi:hypothetical protein